MGKASFKTKRNNTIQALRGIACIIVFLSHAFGMMPTLKYGFTFLHLFYDGKIAVDLFFVLSGYYICKSMPIFSINNYLSYLVKKFLHLYPAYLFSLAIGLILCNLNLPFESDYFSNWFSSFWNERAGIEVFIKQLFFRGDFNAINPPLWTMRYEFGMIILLPLLLKVISSLFHESKLQSNILLLLSISIIFIVGGNHNNIIIIIIYKILITLDFSVLPTFCIGVLIYKNENLILKYINNKWKNVLLLVGGIILMNIENTFALDINEVLLDYIRAIGCSCIIILCLYSNLLNKISRSSYLVNLGNISYEFYLFHFIVLLLMRSIIPCINNWFLSIFLCFILSHLAGYIAHKYIDCRK